MNNNQLDVAHAKEALTRAAKAKKSAERPQPLPRWYGPMIGAMIAIYIASSDFGRALHAPWIIAMVGMVYIFAIGIAISLIWKCQGLIPRFQRAYLIPSLLVVGACLFAIPAAYAAAWAAGIWARGSVAGVIGGLCFWTGAAVVNKRLRIDLVKCDSSDLAL